ncbi:MAG: RluA family pseudouridine synthase, partial [Clostridia bacterium]|nr:RluA family pseudouridine synthase [Clostridia bacterium]
RLDQPVEGLMVFAKNQKAAASLSKQIQQRMLGKYYYAISECAPERLEGMLENYLLTDKKTNVTTVVEVYEEQLDKGMQSSKGQQDLSGAVKKAKLEYRVIASNEKGALFDIKLHTGRQHQIRVQMAGVSHPVFGDMRYGGPLAQKGKLALWAYSLSFTHPVLKERMRFVALPPEDGVPWKNFDFSALGKMK